MRTIVDQSTPSSAPSYVTPPQYNSGYLYPGHSSVFPEHALTAFAPSPISSSSASSMSVSRSVSPFSSPLSSAPSTLASHLPSPANTPAPVAHSSKPSWLTPSGCGACQGTHEWQHGAATSSRELRSVWSADHTWECGFPDGQGGFCQDRLSGRSKPELNNHMRATHGWPSNGDKMMHCPFASVCKHGQKKAESMAQHIMDIHWASTMVECTHCLQTFTRATSGHRHINDSVLQCNRQHTLATVKGQVCPPPNPRIPNDASVLVTKKGKKTTMQLNAPTDASSKTSRKLVRGGDDDNYVDNAPSGSRHTRSSSRQFKRELDDSHVTSISASRSSRNDVRYRPY
jgi:hypothetical protein